MMLAALFHRPPQLTQQRVAEIASKHRADLRDVPRSAQPVEARGEGLLKRGRDGLRSGVAPLEQ
jgi:hypothetical protein